MALGVRSYGNALLTQNIFDLDNLPDTIPALNSFASRILTPTLTCTESDCKTPIGRLLQVPESDAEGLISLTTSQIISERDIINKILADNYTIRVRDTSTCLTEGGFCRNCGRGYYARIGVYDTPGLGEALKFTSSARSYQNYIAGTFSGALMGWEELASDPLPLTPSSWDYITSHPEMDRLCRLLQSKGLPRDDYNYLFTVTDILERALLIIGTYGVYGNV